MTYPWQRQPSSITVAVVVGFVQAGLSTLVTVGMLVLASAMASDMGVDMGGIVWAIAIAQLFIAMLLVFGTVQLRRGEGRTPYVSAAALHLVNCLLWLILFYGNGNPIYPMVPLLLGALTIVGLVQAAKPASAEYVRVRRG
jgi:hypothetical protein